MSILEGVRAKVRHTLEFFGQRQRAYKLAFGSPAGHAVLEHLAKFCHASETCYHDDPRLHALTEGRREVWLVIQRYLHLTPEELFTLYSGRTINRLITEAKEQDDDRE